MTRFRRVGLGSAMAMSRLLAKLLLGVDPTDPLTITVVAMLLAVVVTLACWHPADRATRTVCGSLDDASV